MSYYNQLLEEIEWFIDKIGSSDYHLQVGYPERLYSALCVDVDDQAYTWSTSESFGIKHNGYHITVKAESVDLGRVYAGRDEKYFIPISTSRKSCAHEWVTSYGLFRSYRDCKKCGAKHEALHTDPQQKDSA